jgi:hypothetical protein
LEHLPGQAAKLKQETKAQPILLLSHQVLTKDELWEKCSDAMKVRVALGAGSKSVCCEGLGLLSPETALGQ